MVLFFLKMNIRHGYGNIKTSSPWEGGTPLLHCSSVHSPARADLKLPSPVLNKLHQQKIQVHAAFRTRRMVGEQGGSISRTPCRGQAATLSGTPWPGSFAGSAWSEGQGWEATRQRSLPELRQWPGSRVGPAAQAGGRLPVSAGGENVQAGEEKGGKEQGASSDSA